MSYETIALLMFSTLMLMMLTGQRIFGAIGFVAVVAALALWGTGGSDLGYSAVMKLMKWNALLTLPMFIFMGYVMSETRLAADLYRMFHVWMGPLPGGLAIGTILLMVMISAMNGLSVADHDACSRDRNDLPIAPHLGLRRSHFLERRDGFLRIVFLVETDGCIEHDNSQDGYRIDYLAEQAGDHAGDDENPDNETFELPEENVKWADAFAFCQFVRSVRREPFRCLLYRQSGCGRSDFLEHICRGMTVPQSIRL